MLQIQDIRESRVYQEAKEEGLKEGIEKGIAISITKMAAKKMAAEQIASILELDVDMVQKVMSDSDRK